ncbi:hypothetical protein DFS34DRAFT_25434 [Phlyctochytrium arcticum]|nr:hypothetical protein DFS34DRAFT_644529 [Phlyctochytrium arcticum]KAI9105725.1 hypothetical protein DFS34DRAFT_25434 [Phlyctochytrium arcticum]
MSGFVMEKKSWEEKVNEYLENTERQSYLSFLKRYAVGNSTVQTTYPSRGKFHDEVLRLYGQGCANRKIDANMGGTRREIKEVLDQVFPSTTSVVIGGKSTAIIQNGSRNKAIVEGSQNKSAGVMQTGNDNFAKIVESRKRPAENDSDEKVDDAYVDKVIKMMKSPLEETAQLGRITFQLYQDFRCFYGPLKAVLPVALLNEEPISISASLVGKLARELDLLVKKGSIKAILPQKFWLRWFTKAEKPTIEDDVAKQLFKCVEDHALTGDLQEANSRTLWEELLKIAVLQAHCPPPVNYCNEILHRFHGNAVKGSGRSDFGFRIVRDYEFTALLTECEPAGNNAAHKDSVMGPAEAIFELNRILGTTVWGPADLEFVSIHVLLAGHSYIKFSRLYPRFINNLVQYTLEPGPTFTVRTANKSQNIIKAFELYRYVDTVVTKDMEKLYQFLTRNSSGPAPLFDALPILPTTAPRARSSPGFTPQKKRVRCLSNS